MDTATLRIASSDAMQDFLEQTIASIPSAYWTKGDYHVASHIVQLNVAGQDLSEFMREAIVHISCQFAVGSTQLANREVQNADEAKGFRTSNLPADLNIYAVDEPAVGLSAPEVPWSWHSGDREGYFHGFDRERFTVNFDQATQSLRMLDRKLGVALHWMRNRKLVPYWERSFPMREILNWWYRDQDIQPVHAAAVGIDGKGALIAAKGGSGKSSTALSCLLAGMQFAGDDFVLTDIANLRAYSLYSIAKLEPHVFDRFPELKPPPDTPMIDQNKYQISLARLMPERLQRVLDLKVILVPVITHGPKTYVTPIDSSEAASALMLSTFYLLKGDLRATFQKITKLTQQLPTMQLHLGLDFDNIPNVIRETIEHA